MNARLQIVIQASDKASKELAKVRSVAGQGARVSFSHW